MSLPSPLAQMERDYRHLAFRDYALDPHDCNASDHMRALYARWLRIGDRAFTGGPKTPDAEPFPDPRDEAFDAYPPGGWSEPDEMEGEDEGETI